MKKVQCVSIHGQTELSVVDLGTAALWHNGEIKNLTDEQARIALTNPNFIEVVETADTNASPAAFEPLKTAAPIQSKVNVFNSRLEPEE